MCGIYFSYTQYEQNAPRDQIYSRLKRRGPDCSKSICLRSTGNTESFEDHDISNYFYLSFHATLLSLRGSELTEQPLEDLLTGSILCWNGEAWKINDQNVPENDSKTLFARLLNAAKPHIVDERKLASSDKQTTQAVISLLANVAGPAAFVFFDAQNERIFFGRDAFGRRSLLQKRNMDGDLYISSVRDVSDDELWDEVKAGGIYMLELARSVAAQGRVIQIYDHTQRLAFSKINRQTSKNFSSLLNLKNHTIDILANMLHASLLLRVQDVPIPVSGTRVTPRIAILFSGGLDCTLLARLIHDILPKEFEIDLLNVAFENPRVLKSLRARSLQPQATELSMFSLCPDRRTGLASHLELLRVCPGRTWRMVTIDIAYSETLSHRDDIVSLIHPNNTEMDLSIACALYFAARGSGMWLDQSTGSECHYTTPARVLISGMGADEIFAGYARHATSFHREGLHGLLDALETDFTRLRSQNLGRDDRVISHWGKEARYPYLDEDLVSWALGLPIWEKCGFGQGEIDEDSNEHIKGLHLEPGKKLLRLLAWKLNMQSVAIEKKKAIQFGARTAKMEVGRMKGTQALF